MGVGVGVGVGVVVIAKRRLLSDEAPLDASIWMGN